MVNNPVAGDVGVVAVLAAVREDCTTLRKALVPVVGAVPAPGLGPGVGVGRRL